MSLPEKYDHPLYKHVKDEKEADAVAWAFVNKEKVVKFPFKFPPLGPKELRANVLYFGLCHSDVLTVREGWGPAPFPLAPGHEIVAQVSQVGSDVKNYKKGDLVGFGTFRDACEKCRFCKEGREELLVNAKILILMELIGEDMLLLCNNLLTFSSIYLKNLIWLKELLCSVLVLPLFTR